MNSISDIESYKKICKEASENETHFNNFKRNPEYNGILEHVSEFYGFLYLEEIEKKFPNYLEYIEEFKKNDVFGNPIKYQYPSVGEISPSTLRYIKVLSDLFTLFGSLDNKKIIEIGGGYGGQALVINKMFKVSEYTLIDLDEALDLSSKYLRANNIDHNLLRIEDLEKSEYDFDLVISNYAYSEVNRTMQDTYYEKIIRRSKNGYFTYNFISELCGVDSYSKEEVFQKFYEKEIKIMEEVPKTHQENIIIYF
jgi:hypothetical protein